MTRAADLLEQCFEQIRSTESTVKAWLHIDEAGATKQATEIKDDDRRPLAGVAFGIKDLFDVEGMPTTAGSRVLRGNIAKSDAPVVTKLRKAGAVIIGKTNTHEFAYGLITRPTSNPWDQSRIPGGSSGGSAAAVAANHCQAALGSDTGGSIRVPAALCGVSGLKPRPGVIPTEGVIPLAPSFDVVGPIARTAAELRTLWDVLGDTASTQDEAPFRMGFVPESLLPALDGGVSSAFEDALKVLARLGELKETEVPHFDDFLQPRLVSFMPEVLEVHRSKGWWPDHADEYTDEIRSYLEYTESHFTEAMIDEGKSEAKRLTAKLAEVVSGFDAVATPTCPIPAPTHEEAARTEEGSARRPMANILTVIPAPVNLAGLAAISIPCGFVDGLPIGLHLIGNNEDVLLSIAEAFQRETDWHDRRPMK
jgi:aspartyl-tRNA(Asn)/glutamyl-tRNA(Gln) amidotransferase subunit A